MIEYSAKKPKGYYSDPRWALVGLVNDGPNKVLDVGCGEGQTGAALKAGGKALEVVGIEKDAAAAKMAESTNIVVKRDTYLCMDAGFCANRVTCVEKMVPQTHDTQVRSHVMAMIERCPSGSYVYALREGEADVEPDLPRQVAVTTETTWAGSIDGPLWVTGKIPVQRADGQPFEVRNRVTLCRCGLSSKKPLCDSTHRGIGVTED